MCSSDLVVRTPKVRDQNSRERLLEKSQHHRTGTAFVDHIIRRVLRRKRPQPMRFAVDSPTRFIAVQNARTFHHLTDFIVPTFQYQRQSPPKIHQSAFRQLEIKLRVEDGDDLRDGWGSYTPPRRSEHSRVCRIIPIRPKDFPPHCV